MEESPRFELEVPVLDSVTGTLSSKQTLFCDEFDLFTIAADHQAIIGGGAIFRILMTAFKGRADSSKGFKSLVCPLSLLLGRQIFEFHIDGFSDLETAAGEYKQLPYPGSLLEQPAWVLDGFAHLRMGRSQAERDIQEEIMHKGNDPQTNRFDAKRKPSRRSG